jgi:hypothetical protein
MKFLTLLLSLFWTSLLDVLGTESKRWKQQGRAGNYQGSER